MAQLLLINKITEVPGVREIGDLVLIAEDTHNFSDLEKEKFDVVIVKGTKADYVLLKDAATPKKPILKRTGVTGWSEEEPEEKEVWKDGEEYRELAESPAHIVCWEDGKFVHNFARKTENLTVVVVEKKIIVLEDSKV